VQGVLYVTAMKYLDEITPVRLRYFPSDGPASTIVAVSALAFPELRVEIEAVATAP
jgi:enamine deaminase RidA (YjgF/YER057c/UK114 family)